MTTRRQDHALATFALAAGLIAIMIRPRRTPPRVIRALFGLQTEDELLRELIERHHRTVSAIMGTDPDVSRETTDQEEPIMAYHPHPGRKPPNRSCSVVLPLVLAGAALAGYLADLGVRAIL